MHVYFTSLTEFDFGTDYGTDFGTDFETDFKTDFGTDFGTEFYDIRFVSDFVTYAGREPLTQPNLNLIVTPNLT